MVLWDSIAHIAGCQTEACKALNLLRADCGLGQPHTSGALCNVPAKILAAIDDKVALTKHRYYICQIAVLFLIDAGKNK